MQKMILANKKELSVVSIVDCGGTLEITFGEGNTYEEIAKIYDSYENPEFSADTLRRFELYTEDVLQGVHMGYTETKDISAFNGIVKVKVKQEDVLKTEVEALKQQNAILSGAISELTMIVSMGNNAN